MQITEINIYPIKSTAQLRLDEAQVEPRGLQFDRRAMLVDTAGKFMTAREHPRLLQIRARPRSTGFDVTAPGRPALSMDFADFGPRSEVTIWRDTTGGHPAPPPINAWFSEWLNADCRLMYMPDSVRRSVDPVYAGPQDTVSFADGFPLLLISAASLAALNERLADPVPMIRFRPSVVVDGDAPFCEDHWRRIRIGALEFELVKPCARCVMTTIDPDTAMPDPDRQPLRTLMQFRMRRGTGALFGQNLVPRTAGRIALGDEVQVLDGD